LHREGNRKQCEENTANSDHKGVYVRKVMSFRLWQKCGSSICATSRVLVGRADIRSTAFSVQRQPSGLLRRFFDVIDFVTNINATAAGWSFNVKS
jgi:hypothetical protein